jgi:perosamine synthetase
MARKVIPISHPLLQGNEKKYVNECLDTTWISSAGRFIQQFEDSFASLCHVPHAIACSNGTTALHLALLAAGIQPGDEVIVPTFTYVASANAIRYCDAVPVFVDAEPATMNADPSRIEQKVTNKTRAILAVHLYGHPVDMDAVLGIARRHNLAVIEDAAEALGAEYKGRRTGSLGDIATFSFFGNKTITTGEGGMVTTGSADIASRVRLLRGQGMDPDRRYWFPIIGYNYRMTNIQAAIGLAQLEQIDVHLRARRNIAGWYNNELAGLQDIFVLPKECEWAHHSYWMYTVVLRPGAGLDRDRVMQKLAEAGVETRPAFYPMHVMPVYREPDGTYPVAEYLGANGISLPTHALLTAEDVHYIARQLADICAAGEA